MGLCVRGSLCKQIIRYLTYVWLVESKGKTLLNVHRMSDHLGPIYAAHIMNFREGGGGGAQKKMMFLWFMNNVSDGSHIRSWNSPYLCTHSYNMD